ncbi:MAG: class I SAM-dependent methyltransferase [Chloroflexi bacterium]|nr:class I SAM-dependent methyltransferase [Chloroflexota bacterium]
MCDVCEKNSLARTFAYTRGTDGGKYNLVQCNVCGMIVVWPPPTKKFLDSFYASYKGRVKKGIIEWGDPIQANRAAIEDGYLKMKYVVEFAGIKQRGRVLDIGCGHGFFVYAVQDLGYQALGVDVDPEAIDFGQSRLGIDIEKVSIDCLEVLQKDFDIVTAWQVLEHLRMPGSCTRSVSKLLKPGGVFAGSVPNVGGITARLRGTKWYLMIPPEHLNYFTERSMKHMLTQAGLVPLFVGTIPLYASPYFSFGIRVAIMRLSRKTSIKPVKAICKHLHRSLTLAKRHLVYKLLNILIIRLKLGGNSIFFVASKTEPSE